MKIKSRKIMDFYNCTQKIKETATATQVQLEIETEPLTVMREMLRIFL